MELLLGLNLKFYTSVAKGLKLKVRKFWELIPPFVEVTREKLVGLTFKKEFQLRRFPIVRNCIRQKQPSKRFRSSRRCYSVKQLFRKLLEPFQENIRCRVLVLVDLRADCLEQLFHTKMTPSLIFSLNFLNIT